MPARQVQRTVACVGRGLSERESTIVTTAPVFQYVGGLSVVYQISLEERSVAQRKNVGYDPNCCMTHQRYIQYVPMGIYTFTFIMFPAHVHETK